MAVIASIDGPSRRIFLHADTVDATWEPVQLYREYRALRRSDETLRRYDALLLMEGNIPKGGGKATPRYMLLLDGTRIIPFDAAGVTTVAGEIITDDQAEPFDFSTLTQPMVVDKQPTDAEIVYIETPSPIQDRLDYNGIVWIDPTSGNVGQLHPTGTLGQPVDNVPDAIAIAATNNCDTLKIKGTNLAGASALTDLIVEGRNPVSSVLVLQGGDTTFSNLRNLTMTGAGNGRIYGRECIVGSISNFSGGFAECVFAGVVTVDPTYTDLLHILQSASAVTGVSRPVFDINGAACDVSCRDYYGGMNVRNFNQGRNASFDLSSAVIQIEATCTNGLMKFEGDGRVLDANGDLIPRGSSVINGGLTVINEAKSNESIAATARDTILGTESFP